VLNFNLVDIEILWSANIEIFEHPIIDIHQIQAIKLEKGK
jgi:hypothetical protein